MSAKVGDVLRLRNLRHYGADPRIQFDFVPDHEKKKELKKVFVCMLLGTEPLDMTTSEGESLDLYNVLNRLGWWSEEQILAAQPKAGKQLIQKMAKEKIK